MCLNYKTAWSVPHKRTAAKSCQAPLRGRVGRWSCVITNSNHGEEASECNKADASSRRFCSLLHTFTELISYSSRCMSPYLPSLIMQTKKAPHLSFGSNRCWFFHLAVERVHARKEVTVPPPTTTYYLGFWLYFKLCNLSRLFGCDLSFTEPYSEVCEYCMHFILKLEFWNSDKFCWVMSQWWILTMLFYYIIYRKGHSFFLINNNNYKKLVE